MTPGLHSQRPTLLHISAGLDFGGVETHLRTIAIAPHKRYEHMFCAIMVGGVEADAIAKSGGQVRVLNIDPWRRPLQSLAALVRLVREVRPQIVHCHGLEGNFFGLLAAGYCRVPLRIGEEIGIPDRSARMRKLMSVVYRLAHRVIGVSEAVRKWLIGSGEVPASKAVRLYNPVTMSDQCAQPRLPGETLRIAFLGRLDAVKNLPALISAVTLLPNDANVELIIIGEGNQRPELERLIHASALQAVVQLRGFSPTPNEELVKCHLYIQPSLAEGFGIAVVEAMSCGLPAIVSDRGGMPEIVEHGRTGWIIESLEPQGIADAILKAARLDPLELARMGRAARESVKERFDANLYVARLEQLCDEWLLARGKR